MRPGLPGKDIEMEHTPYGYKIVNGKAVIDEDKAAVLRKICDNYLSGMSYVAAAADAGITMKHRGVKRLLQNKKYLGDDFYPAIFMQETLDKIEAERQKREKALGRDRRKGKAIKKSPIYTEFFMPRVPKKYDDAVKQAEYAYSLIISEVSK